MPVGKSVNRSIKKPTPPAALDLAVVNLVAQGKGILPKRNKCRLRACPKKLRQKNRFAAKGGEQLNTDAMRFGAAMTAYLGSRNKAGWTPAEVLDVMMSLGYRNHEKDFEVNVHQFTTALAAFKKKRRRLFPTFSEVLAVAAGQGWYLRAVRAT